MSNLFVKCPGCGAYTKSSNFLCPDCLARNRAYEQARKEKLQEKEDGETTDPKLLP